MNIGKVSIYNQSIEMGGGDIAEAVEQSMPTQADTQWFSDAMNNQEVNLGDRIIDRIEGMSDHLKAKRTEVDENLKNSQSADSYTDMIKGFREMSDYGFQTALTAKVIAKCSQAVEKLTNLQ